MLDFMRSSVYQWTCYQCWSLDCLLCTELAGPGQLTAAWPRDTDEALFLVTHLVAHQLLFEFFFKAKSLKSRRGLDIYSTLSELSPLHEGPGIDGNDMKFLTVTLSLLCGNLDWLLNSSLALCFLLWKWQ